MESGNKNQEKIKRLYRSKEEKKIFGICGGLAEYFELDPTIVRIILLFLIIFGSGVFLLIYVLLYFIIPTKDMNKKPITLDFSPLKERRIKRSVNNRMIAGICGGIAEYFKVDPVIVRIAVVIIDVLTGFFPVIILYFLLIWVIPLDSSEKPDS